MFGFSGSTIKLKNVSATAVARASSARKPPSLLEMVAIEALVAASINTFMSGIVAWVMFHRLAYVPVWGARGVMFSTLPTSIFPAVAMTVAGTIAMRKRFVKAIFGNQLPMAPGWIARLPENLAARTFLFAVCTAVPVVVVTFLGVSVTAVTTLSFLTVMVTQVIQAILIGVVLGPVIVLRTLAEPRNARSEG